MISSFCIRCVRAGFFKSRVYGNNEDGLLRVALMRPVVPPYVKLVMKTVEGAVLAFSHVVYRVKHNGGHGPWDTSEDAKSNCDLLGYIIFVLPAVPLLVVVDSNCLRLRL